MYRESETGILRSYSGLIKKNPMSNERQRVVPPALTSMLVVKHMEVVIILEMVGMVQKLRKEMSGAVLRRFIRRMLEQSDIWLSAYVDESTCSRYGHTGNQCATVNKQTNNPFQSL